MFADSSLSHVIVTGDHVSCAHANNLTDCKAKMSMDQSFIASKIKGYPQLNTAKCECAGKRAHSKNCGCMSDAFLAFSSFSREIPSSLRRTLLSASDMMKLDKEGHSLVYKSIYTYLSVRKCFY